MKLANLITLSRLVLAPVFLLAFTRGSDTGDRTWLVWAFVLACSFEITDMVDGWVARRFEQTSNLGKILDPLADSISRFTVFLAFLAEGYVSAWVVAPMFWRDSIVSTIRVLAASQGIIVSARFSGKVKAIVQGAAILVILAVACFRDATPWTRGWDDARVREFAQYVMTYVAVVTIVSLFDYLWGNRKILKSLDA